MTRHAFVVASLALALAAPVAEAGAAALKPLPVTERRALPHGPQFERADRLLLRAGERRALVRGHRRDREAQPVRPAAPATSTLGSWVRSTRTGFMGHVYVMVVATRTDGNAKAARSEAATAAKFIARLNAGV